MYYVRYGAMGRIDRLEGEDDHYARGERVVVETPRGLEVAEVLTPAPSGPARGRILRVANSADRERERRVRAERVARLEACDLVFRDGIWPLTILDAEPLLEPGRTVLYYLGPHGLEADGLIAALRERIGLDIVLEPVGRDANLDQPAAGAESGGCGSCGEGGCGSGGGCGSDGEHGGCSTCAVKDLVARRGRMPVAS